MAERPLQENPGSQPLQPPPAAVAKNSQAARSLPAFFLRTKLLPPRPAPALLPRPRLTERLLANLAHPVTLVTANAGSGKTTLVADFVRSNGHKFVWYQLESSDADPLVFLGYVTHGIKQAVPGFGEVMLSYMQESAAELAQQPERAVDVMLNEVLENVEQQFILVLDDYHHLGAETAVHGVVDRLLAYLPDVMHVIIISRDVPPLSLARLRSQASLAIIDRNELLFTDEETQELFRKVFDLELTPEQLSEYRERTHGWITALQLVRQVAQRQALAHSSSSSGGGGGRSAPDLVEILRQSERDIFDYFAEEVFAGETQDVQQLLLRVSLLDRLDLETCGRLYPGDSCSSVLPALVRRNVFITVASDERGEEYRLHPLFQGFLRRRLRSEIGQAGVAQEHSRIADYFLDRGSWEQAVHHLVAAEDFERAARVIADKGGEWIASGALSSLVSFAEALPTGVIERQPRALAHRAEVARLRGNYDSAQMLFSRAVPLLREQNDREGEAEALHSLASIARRRGDCVMAFTYLDSAVELTDEHSVVRIKCGNTRGLCLLATGELEAAEREFRAALQFAEEQGNEHYMRLIAHNLGLPAAIRGDFGEALRWSRRMLRKGDNHAPVPQEATGHLNVARFNSYRGELEECEQHLDQALEISQLFNLIALRAEIFESYGNLYRERGDMARAAEFYERSMRAYDEAGVDLTRTELLEEQALLFLQAGNVGGARSQLDRLVSARAGAGDELRNHTARLARGRVIYAQGDYEVARDDLERARAYFNSQKLYYFEAQACLALAYCDLATSRDQEMLENLGRTLDLAARYDYENWLQRELARNPRLLAHTDAAELLPPDLREQLAQEAAPSLQNASPPLQVTVASAPMTDLTINVLGPVEILRDPLRPLAADAWTTKRARDILCFIATRRHRRASKDTITDTFWGEADFEVVEKNFHPTVSHIRKALNSNQPLKQKFLLYRDGDYLLNPEFSYRIDTEEFDRLVADGEAARRAREFERCIQIYEQAIALYRGEFMQGSYEDWVEEQRSYYSEQHLRMLEALAAVAQKMQEWPRSLDLAQRILQTDPFREDIHCMMMRAHAALGNRVAVKEQYENLKRLLRKELGVDPAADTQKIFRELVS
ncbi:MAG TPA: BTAD domain-containing putative transcriptional regulator [Pyrinomonadaceae bacterium]|jgi:ATP/maltotriose-dependent transcriptional regulator MalT/DNA-binding SARP family transcriptional activator|nr:BTAD domain-containing putative transcriptional regulator [Pyrinomonadaceae bacterium]